MKGLMQSTAQRLKQSLKFQPPLPNRYVDVTKGMPGPFRYATVGPYVDVPVNESTSKATPKARAMAKPTSKPQSWQSNDEFNVRSK